ncbi:MAG: hypothetical protein AB8B72_12445 [Crocinitomicaceae bacterium]
MKSSDQVKHIESNYNVSSITYKNLSLWLEIRYRLFSKMFHGEETGLKINSQTYLNVIKSAFYGFFNWFKKYDAWFLSNSSNRLEINGRYYDRFFDYPASKYNKSLFIELTTDKHFPKKSVSSQYIVSRSPLILAEKFISFFINVKKLDLNILESIKQDYQIDFDATYSIKKMVAQYRVMSFLLKFSKPKVIFIAPSYTAFGYMKAFNERKINVVEVQHGVIIKEHFGYNIGPGFDRNYFPDYLLTFGGQESQVFDTENNFIANNKVVPVGSFYLEHINSEFQPSKIIDDLTSNFKFSFTVSLQDVESGEKLVPFIINTAKKNQNIIFILQPRRKPKKYYTSTYNLPNNVVVSEKLNIYELILNTDGHISVYSTCALEAPALGKQNILVNIDGKSKEIFGNTLVEKTTTQYVNTEIELQDCLVNFEALSPKVIQKAHKDVLKSNYKVNMDSFLNRINE